MPTPKPELSHAQLVLLAERWLTRQNCGVVFRDGFRAPSLHGECPDAIGWRHAVSILVECKASRADFLADRAKPFRINPEKGVGDWRFFLCPRGMIAVEELPKGWGLLYAGGGRISAMHGVPQRMRWRTRKPFTGNKVCELQMMYAALRRFAVRGHLDQIYLPVGVSKDMSDLEALGEDDPAEPSLDV